MTGEGCMIIISLSSLASDLGFGTYTSVLSPQIRALSFTSVAWHNRVPIHDVQIILFESFTFTRSLSELDLLTPKDNGSDNIRFWLYVHNCQVPTPASQNLELEQQIRIF